MTKKLKKPIVFLSAAAVLAAALLCFIIGAAGNFGFGTRAYAEIIPEQPTTGDGAAETPYEINTAEELYWFAGLVNGTLDGVTQDASANAILMADITLNGNVLDENGALAEGSFISWTPIGSKNSAYTGTFNGNSKTISGLYFNDSNANYVGLFGSIGSGGKVSDLTIADSYFDGLDEVGGVCGFNGGGTITNCTNSGTVSAQKYVGGVCGENYGEITECTNSGNVSAQKYVGGVCGFSNEKIINCCNIGAVTGTVDYVGGVCGWSNAFIVNCYNAGTISGKGTVGGVCGNYPGINYVNNYLVNNYFNSSVYSGSAIGNDVNNVNNIGKTTEQFASGEVAYLLGQGCVLSEVPYDGSVWGQTLTSDNADKYPVLNSERVYMTAPCHTYTNTQPTEPKDHVFNVDTGICDDCGEYEPADYDSENDCYKISNMGQLYWFAGLVNGTLDGVTQDASANAILMADITVNGNVLDENGALAEGSFISWTPIGSESSAYTGKFNGNGMTISGLYFDDSTTNYVGLFGYIGSGGEVSDLSVADSYFYGRSFIGGVCGYNFGAVTNCSNSGTVKGANAYIGGVCGNNAGSITNCYNIGTVTGEGDCVGGVCGDNGGTVANCYYLAIIETDNIDGTTYKTAAQFASGEAAYLLNGDRTPVVWGQTLTGADADKYPVLGGAPVYKSSPCVTYTNTEPTEEKQHSFNEETGICENCGDLKEAEFDSENDCYKISNLGQLYWFAGLVNGTLDGVTQDASANAILMADITVNANVLNADGTLAEGSFREWVPVGFAVEYTGEFDGNYNTISGLYFDDSNTSYVGLFGRIGSGGKVSCLSVSDSYLNGNEYVGGICGINSGVITDCSFIGAVSASDYVGGVCGRNSSAVTNCYNIDAVGDTSNVISVCGSNSATVTNCFYLADSETDVDYGTTYMTAAQFASGKAAYLLNGGRTPVVWGQTLTGTNADKYPVLGGAEIYVTAPCVAYTDDPDGTEKQHDFNNVGVCNDCGEHDVPELNDGAYEIYNKNQLYWFAQYVNGEIDGYKHLGANAKLMDNITVNEGVLNENGALVSGEYAAWTPIGSDSFYTGTFNGNSKTISGLYNYSNANYVGLFGYIGSGGKVSDLTIADSYFAGNTYVGGVCGRNDGKITNCYNTGSVTGSGDKVGGVCGFNNGGTITDCTNSGTVSSESNYVGGVCGENYGEITDCTNSGEVAGEGDNVGGVCGRNGVEITNCTNSGAVSGSRFVGGVCGSNVGTISDCTNSGTVSSESDFVGGVCGYNDNGAKITNCTNSGEVSGESSYVGGVCGYNNTGTITNCYYLADSETDELDGTTYKTAEQFAGGEVAYLLNGDQTNIVWGQTLTGDDVDQYPVLGGVRVYSIGPCPAYANDQNATNSHNFNINGICSACGEYEPADYDSENDCYKIGNMGQLYRFAKYVNGEIDGTKHLGANAILIADITVNVGVLNENGALVSGEYVEWTPIGGDSSAYTGTFNGNNKKISGLYFNNGEANYVGLFGHIGEGGKVSDLTIADSYFAGNTYVGGVCGENEGGTITNCTNSGTVGAGSYVGGVCGFNSGTITGSTNSGTISGEGNQVGGVCGFNNGGTITDCTNSGTVSSESNYVGGVCGENYGEITDCTNSGEVAGEGDNVGGVCGRNGVEITNCTNSGTVSSESDYVGGVCGSNGGTISDCTTDISSTVTGKSDYVGGVCGYNDDGTITDCTNSGTVSSESDNVGGVCGENYGEITDCNNSGEVAGEGDNVGGVCGGNDGTITNCTNSGTVTGKSDYVGGVCGRNYEGTITDCNNSGTVSGSSDVGGVCGLSSGKIIGCDNEGGKVTGSGDFVGGVCGYNEGGTITDCNNSGIVSGSSDVGGVCGLSSGKIIGCDNEGGKVTGSGDSVGGVCGRNYEGTITDCNNSGTVNSESYNLGGVCGNNYGGEITDCTNSGTVSSESNSVGGVCGNNGGTITECINSGTVSSESYYVGGVCGNNSGTITECDNDGGAVTGEGNNVGGVCGRNDGTITNCTNSGTVTGKSDYVGGVCGYNDGGTITDCTNSGTVTGNYNYVGGVCSYNCNDGKITGSTNSGEVSGNNVVGGVCGYNDGGEITESTNSGKVTGNNNYVGGVCGCNNGTIANCDNDGGEVGGNGNVGGVCGYNFGGEITENTNSGTVSGEGDNVGGVCGRNDGTITDCTNSGTVSSESDNVGGVCGYNNGGTITDCDNSGNVSGEGDNVGGVCGYNNGRITGSTNSGEVSGNSYVGGVCGNNYYGVTITDCTNIGTVSGNSYVGGVCGDNHGEITDCTNSGTVSGSVVVGGVCGENAGTITNCYNIGSVTGEGDYVGGVCGYNSSDGTMTDCYNTGTVSGSGDSVGGVCGENAGTITNCYNIGSVTGEGDYVGGVCGYNSGTTTNCYNTGTVSGESSYVGGVCGYNSYGTITNCYYLADSETDNIDGTTYKTAAQFASGEAAYLLNGDQTTIVWGQTLTGDDVDQYPVLGGERVYRTEPCRTYTNTEPTEPKAHVFDDDTGICVDCGEYDKPELNSESVYEIYNKNQLYWFAMYVNGEIDGTKHLDANAILMADITVNANVLDADGALTEGSFREWTPIGSTNSRYTGTFNGNSKTISGLYFNNGEASFVGLFGNIGSGGKVSDLTIADSYFAGDSNVGGVCGYNYTGTITNCTNSGTVSGSGEDVGGVCGINYGTITDCTNSGTVSAVTYVGGACGVNDGTVTNCTNSGTVSGNNAVGGVCGNNTGTITGCTNSGEVTGEGASVGGVCGYNDGGTITDCTNDGGTVGGEGNYVGGVCGNNRGEITGCTNSGTVRGNASVGGVCGNNSYGGTITNCYNTGTVSGEGNYVGGVCGYNDNGGEITSCYNIGTVSGNSYVGGVCGYNDDGTITNCYYLADSETDDIDGTTYKTAAQFAGGEAAYLLNGDQTTIVWGQTLTGDDVDQYPVLGGERVYRTEPCHTYINTEPTEPKDHVFDDDTGICVDCGEYDKPELNSESVYEIYNKNQLYWFAMYVNGEIDGTKHLDANAILMADITVNANVLNADGTLAEGSFREWTPIGSADSGYTGTFNGNSKTISGLYFNNGEASFVGLFGHIGSGGKVSDLTIADSYFAGDSYVGGVCGENNGGTITECTNSGTVSGSGEDVGGVCGINYGTITDCTNSGTVRGKAWVGGVCGGNGGTITGCNNSGTVSSESGNVGGVCAANYSTVTNCTNSGTVSGEYHVGGVCGNNNGEITGCTNSGTFSGTGDYVGGVCGTNSGTITDCTNSGTVIGSGDYVGGVCGYNEGGTITDCNNSGIVSGSSYVGGVCGNNYGGEITDCTNSGTVSSESNSVGGVCGNNGGTITECTNSGTVSSESYYVGGVCGNNSGTITECDNDGGAVTGEGNNVGGVCGNNSGTITECTNSGTVSSESYYVGGVCGNNSGTITECDNDGGAVTGEGDNVGGVCGGNGGTITNCDNDGGAVTGEGDYVGGVCGNNFNGGTITECTNSGTVSGRGTYVGGVCGSNGGEITNCTNSGEVTGRGIHVGGVCGYNDGTITECTNSGTVSGTGEAVGGVCGYNDGTITECTNSGTVSGTGEAVGGVCGKNVGKITDCYNSGTVSSESNNVGGVCGSNYVNSTITNCYNTGAVSGSSNVGGVFGNNFNGGTITNCYNTGAVSGSSNVGGVCGSNYNGGTITNCYYLADSETDKLDGTTYMTAEQFASGEAAYLLNGDQTTIVWGQLIGTDEYPVLDSTNRVYKTEPCLTFTNDPNEANPHNFDSNGICSACGDYEPAEYDSEGNCYKIGNIGQLYWFAGLVNGTLDGAAQDASANAILMADMTVNEGVFDKIVNNTGSSLISWTPIGSDISGYTGTFNGNSKTISGLYIDDLGASYVGLFGYIGEGGKVFDLTVADSFFRGNTYVGGVCGYNSNGTITGCTNGGEVSGYSYNVGGVCGINDGGTITGCTNGGEVSGYSNNVGGVCGCNIGTITDCTNSGTVRADSYVGGVCGFNNGGTITDCTNSGTVGAGSYVGGVCGFNSGTITGSTNSGTISGEGNQVGGVCGFNNGGTITDCTNSGTVSSESNYVGGVCGGNGGEITNCTNSGAVSGSSGVGGVCINNYGEITNCTNSGTVSGSSDVGGVCNCNNGGTITECTNSGAVSGESDYVGGVCGGNGGTITECTNSGAVSGESDYVGGVCCFNSSGTITDCTNSGKVSGTGYNVGGVCGFNFSGTITDCTNSGEVSADSYVGGVCGFNSSGTITDCTNSGEVSADSYVGGVCSYNSYGGTITDCTNSGEVSADSYAGGVCGFNYGGTITDCINIVAVSGNDNVGGVCGYNKDSGEITNCYYNKDFCAVDNGIGTGLTTLQMTSPDALTLMGFGAAWNKSDNYPEAKKASYPDLAAIEGDTVYVSYEAELVLTAVNAELPYGDEAVFEIDVPVKFDGMDGYVSAIGECSADDFKLMYNGKELGEISVVDGKIYASADITSLRVGTFNFEAEYVGTKYDIFAGLSNDCVITVIKADISVTAPEADNAIDYGKTLSNVLFSDESWSWADGTIIPTVTNSGYSAVKTVSDYDVYDYSDVAGYDEDTHTITLTAAVTVNPAVPTVIVSVDPASGIVGQTISVGAVISNPNNVALDDLPEATFTYRVNDGEEKPVTGGSFDIPDGTEEGDVITVTAVTPAGGNYAEGTGTARVIVTVCKHEHTTLEHDENSHWYKCSDCGAELNKAAHSGGEATCVDKAVCEICGTAYGNVDSNNHVHVSTEWSTDGTSHWHECSDCGAKLDKATHRGGEATCVDKAVCEICEAAYGNVDGNNHINVSTEWSTDGTSHWHECSACGAKLDKTAHSGGEATCTEKASCEVCGRSYGKVDIDNHTDVETIWSFDETGHWHICLDCGAKLDEAAHISSGAATEYNAEICTVCGYEIAPKLGTVAAPVITPNGGKFSSKLEVTIASATDGAEIYYTTDGTEPTTASTKYTGAFNITETTMVKAIAVKAGMADSSVVTAEFTYTAPKPVTTPEIIPNGGSFSGSLEVTIICATDGAEIYYTTDGTEPTTASTKYTGASNITKTTTIKAIAVKAGMSDSSVAAAIFINTDIVETVATPVITPNGGTFRSTKGVTITCSTEGAEIHYTLNGTDPTAESALYTGKFTVNSTTTVKAIAIKAGMNDSEIASAEFTKSSYSGGGGGSSSGYADEAEPSIDGTSKSWSEIAEVIAKSADGSTITIDMNGVTEIPEEVIKAIAETDSKVEFVADSTFKWIIDGAKITDPVKADLTIDRNVNINTDGLDGTLGTEFSVDGTGIPASLEIKFKAIYGGQFANVYKSENGKLVFAGTAKVGANGRVVLTCVDGEGDYVVMLSEDSALVGDANNDGVVNAFDAAAILRDIVELEKLANPQAADFNVDGTVNAFDAAAILKWVVGIR